MESAQGPSVQADRSMTTEFVVGLVPGVHPMEGIISMDAMDAFPSPLVLQPDPNSEWTDPAVIERLHESLRQEFSSSGLFNQEMLDNMAVTDGIPANIVITTDLSMTQLPNLPLFGMEQSIPGELEPRREALQAKVLPIPVPTKTKAPDTGTTKSTARSANSKVAPPSIKSELSSLIKEIHNTVFEEHKRHPQPVRTKRITETCYVDDRKPVPTCSDLLEAHEIDAAAIPKMSVLEVADMVAKLFGPGRRNLSDIFMTEQIDGAGLLLLNLQRFITLLQLPIGPAVTLDGIVKRAREIHNMPPPE